MNFTLLWISIGLIVVGFLINLLGGWLHERERAGVAAPKTLLELIIQALNNVFKSLGNALKPNQTVGQKVESFGSAIAFIGLALLIVSIALALGQGSTTNPKPSPSASPS